MPPAEASPSPFNTLIQRIDRYRGLIVPVGFILLMTVILIPLPPAILDILISLNISLAVIILLTTIYMKKALEFSVFPSLLLATTLFRLVLNIASTRLILTADAASPEAPPAWPARSSWPSAPSSPATRCSSAWSSS